MSNSRIVFSTDQGRICPACRRPISSCQCHQQNMIVPKGDGIVRISRETKGRKGKGVTLVKGLPVSPEELKSWATRMKQYCGTGGTLKEGVIEIQGDHRDKLLALLQKEGFKAKLAGG